MPWSAPTRVAPLDVHTERIGERPSGHIAPQHPLVVLAREATVAIGRIPELTVASTDANIPLSRGIPAIAIGAGGSGGDTHTLREWYDHEDSARGLWRALAIVAGAANA
jgi:tripeptide aminopeptidase